MLLFTEHLGCFNRLVCLNNRPATHPSYATLQDRDRTPDPITAVYYMFMQEILMHSLHQHSITKTK